VPSLKQILGEPKFIDYKNGANEAYARFESPEAAEAAVKALLDNKTQIGGQEVKAEVSVLFLSMRYPPYLLT